MLLVCAGVTTAIARDAVADNRGATAAPEVPTAASAVPKSRDAGVSPVPSPTEPQAPTTAQNGGPLVGSQGTTSAEPESDPDSNGESALPVDLAHALALAERGAPELLTAEAQRSGLSDLRDAAHRGLHRPPRLEIAMGPRRQPGGGSLGMDASVGVFQEFSLGRYGSHLSAYVEAANERANQNIDRVRRDARVRAHLAWLDALQARELIRLRQSALAEAREIQRVAEARLAAGRTSPGEAALARALVGSAEAAVLAAQGDMTQADATLRHVCGIELHRPLLVVGPLEPPPSLIDEEAVRHTVLRSAPDLRTARAHAVALEKSAQLGRAQSKPHLELGPSVTREGTGDWVFMGHLRMPLPGIDPAAADNAERSLAAHVAHSEVRVLEQAVLRDTELILHEREHALKTKNTLQAGTIEPAQLAAREAQLQYEAGRLDLVSVITTRRELYDALERWTVATVDVQRADAQLSRYYFVEARKGGAK
jgi:cobalt-zinc-cadmium efflux system outer membrane protein